MFFVSIRPGMRDHAGVVWLVQHTRSGTAYAIKSVKKTHGQVPKELACECRTDLCGTHCAQRCGWCIHVWMCLVNLKFPSGSFSAQFFNGCHEFWTSPVFLVLRKIVVEFMSLKHLA